MEYLVTSREMRAYDTYTIEKLKIPALALMERAALAVCKVVMEMLAAPNRGGMGKVLCVCGTGNNGGDGLALTRLLADRGVAVTALLVGDKARMSAQAAKQLEVLERYGIEPAEFLPDEEFDVVVDALFGTGLSREITGRQRSVIEALNEMGGAKIAVDIPSGICADTGKVLGAAFRADVTVALAYRKRGHYLYPGAEYSGQVICADIGINERSFAEGKPEMYTYLEEEPRLPERRKSGNKGTFGKLLLAAGSEDMAGAALLAAQSAYRAGAGMVKLVIPEKIRTIVQTKLPEALIQVYGGGDGLCDAERALFEKNMDWADVIAVGPGLSRGESARALLRLALQGKAAPENGGNSGKVKPLVVDADGLNLLAEDEALSRCAKNRKNLILTPHMGELARLLSRSAGEVTEDETGAALEGMRTYGCVVAAKSARTHVCAPGKPIFLNTAGNDRMATAGSGDVLTGIIAALLGQGLEAYDAAALGVYLHARAGDKAAAGCAGAGLTASDIIAGL